MKKEILRMQDVCAGNYQPYGLDDFRLHICEGEMVDVVGLSGAGKTMIYDFFLGRVPLNKGKVIYNGAVCGEGKRFSRITEVACIGQGSTLIPGLSIAENIFIITGKRKVRGLLWMPNIYFRAKILLGQYAPELSPHTLVQDLSPAEKRMVELLRAIENEVRLVVIDDVLKGYGQSDILRLQGLLRVLKEKNIAILYECHELDFTRALVDKVVVMRKGRTVRTFFEDDYDERLCRKLLIGNEELPVFRRTCVCTTKAALSVRNICGGKNIRDLNLEIHAGEIVGLYDLNNQKNMEFLQMIIGDRPISHGAMYLNGIRYEPRNLDYAIENNIGFIPRNMSDISLLESLSFMDNLYLPVLKKTSRLKFFRNRKVLDFLGEEYLEKLGIPLEEKNKKVKYFDAYIQNSILLTRWVLFKPSLMVCMEPCGNADMIMRGIMFQAFDEMAQNGSAVLIASQNMNELKTICDVVYVLNSDNDNITEIEK